MMPSALIVEDEPEANTLLSLLIQMRGYETESAFTGGDALERVHRHQPDIIFLDLMLPDTNGYDVCKTLKGKRQTNLIPVVMVTARIAAENRLLSYSVGANDYVPKPYTPDEIFQAISAADLWRREIEQHPSSGVICLDTRSDVKPFEQISRLQSLLLARTSWEEDAVRQLCLDLTRMSQNVLEWGRCQAVDRLSTIRYELQRERVALVVDDLGGWFTRLDLPREKSLGILVSNGRFDSVRYNEEGNRVTLAKRFSSSQSLGPI